MESFAALRRMMVDCQMRTYDVTNRAVLAAADEVPREAFLPASLSHLAYLDQAVPLPGTATPVGVEPMSPPAATTGARPQVSQYSSPPPMSSYEPSHEGR